MRQEIEGVIVAYAWAYDEGRAAEAAALFTSDGTLEVSAPGIAPVKGSEAIAAFLAAARNARATRGEQPRHLVNNVRIVESTADEAEVVSYMTLVITHADGSTTLDCAGTYRDRFVRDDGSWKLAARKIAFDRDRPRA
jgi:hypothetical protein